MPLLARARVQVYVPHSYYKNTQNNYWRESSSVMENLRPFALDQSPIPRTPTWTSFPAMGPNAISQLPSIKPEAVSERPILSAPSLAPQTSVCRTAAPLSPPLFPCSTLQTTSPGYVSVSTGRRRIAALAFTLYAAIQLMAGSITATGPDLSR